MKGKKDSLGHSQLVLGMNLSSEGEECLHAQLDALLKTEHVSLPCNLSEEREGTNLEFGLEPSLTHFLARRALPWYRRWA